MKTGFQIVEKLKALTDSLNKKDNGKLISFIWESVEQESEFNYSFLTENYNKVLIFQKFSDNFTLIAVDSVSEFGNDTGKNFSEFSNRLNYLKSNSTNNFDEYNLSSVPLLFIAAKFDADRKSDEWKNFSPITFYVPKFIIFQKSGTTYFIYNFIYRENHSFSDDALRLINFQNNSLKPPTDSNENYRNSFAKIITDFKDDTYEWEKLIGNAKSKLSNGHFQKLVLSRAKSFELNEPLDWNIIIKKLTLQYPDCYLFLFKNRSSIFFGASPEKFLSTKDNFIEVEAVAGSAPRGIIFSEDKVIENNLMESSKIRKEHEYVSNFINQILNDYSGHIYFPESPEVRKLDNIQHLVTKFTASIKSTDILFSLMDRLFPTPAVCGFPKENTIRILRELEKHDRGLYSGLIGWMDLEGNCDFTVAIRSALVEGKTITAFAGAGIVEESDSAEEFYETELKLKPILSLFQNDKKG
ncbi:MAG TPA: isochorismate synthase [Ignavibacteriaceae bacterium]|nr:isochorismate synthase [Ignavibacteriaceae bacterium]